MKRIAVLCATALLVLILIGGCGDNSANDADHSEVVTSQPRSFPGRIVEGEVTITAERQSYPASIEEITVVWRNGTAEEITYGLPFTLQVWIDAQWADVELLPGRGIFNLPGFMLSPQQNEEMTYTLEEHYAPVQAGRYRIAVHYFFDKDRPVTDSDRHHIYAEFEVI